MLYAIATSQINLKRKYFNNLIKLLIILLRAFNLFASYDQSNNLSLTKQKLIIQFGSFMR